MLFIEKDKQTKTAVVCPVVRTDLNSAFFDIEKRIEEAEGLVLAMGQAIVFSESVKVSEIVSGTFFGKGTVERLKAKCREEGAELLVVDRALSPVQQRNLERALEVKVIDRTAVILEIFGRRAQTKEGKLQVELAHLTYQKGRLVRSWTHLERQRGGGGFLGGPGETQIELDRRHLLERINKIKKELEKVKKTRTVQRTARSRVPYPTAALVGYTNAGKSTLFNYITKAQVFAKDMLFATLDPTLRKVELGGGGEVILSDTVGFISNLPHELVMAFRATLEEVLQADIIIHVIDASNPEHKKQREDVLEVLHELGLEKIESSSNYFEVYNKIDLLEVESRQRLKERLFKNTLSVSAQNGEGIDELLRVLRDKIAGKCEIKTVCVAEDDGKGLAEIYQKAEVLESKRKDGKICLTIRAKRDIL